MVHLVRNHNYGIVPSTSYSNQFPFNPSPPFIDPGGVVERLSYPADAVYDSAGNAYIANANKNHILKIDPLFVVTIFAGSEDNESGNVDATGLAARFFKPTGLCIDSSDNIFVVDQGNLTVRKITAAGVVTTIAGGNLGYNDGTGNLAEFTTEIGPIAWDPASTDLFMIDQIRIRRVTQAGVVTTLTGSEYSTQMDTNEFLLSFRPYPFIFNLADNKTLIYSPIPFTGLQSASGAAYTISPAGILTREIGLDIGVSLLAQSSAAAYRTVDEMPGIKFTIYGATQQGIYSTDDNGDSLSFQVGNNTGLLIDGQSQQGSFKQVKGMVFYDGPLPSNTDWKLYVTDFHTVRRVDLWPIPEVTTMAGSPTTPGDAVGFGPIARFNNPTSICIDPATEECYICDTGNHKIKKMTAANVVSNFIGTGIQGNIDGPRLSADISEPHDIVFHPNGNLYFISGYCIKECNIGTGNVATVAGDFYVTGIADGTGANARFKRPLALQVNQEGDLLLIDEDTITLRGTLTRRVRKVTISGFNVSTLAGIYGAELLDGDNVTSQFRAPLGIAVDSTGQVFVSDTDIDDRGFIRKIDNLGNTTLFAGGGLGDDVDAVGPAASFPWLRRLKSDASDNLFVIDSDRKIRQITTGASVTTFAGSALLGTVNGPLLTATFENMYSLGINQSNNDMLVLQSGSFGELYTPAIARLISGGNVTSLDTTEIGPVQVLPGQPSLEVPNILTVPAGPDGLDEEHPSTKVCCVKKPAAEVITQYDIVYLSGGEIYKLDTATAPIRPNLFGIARNSAAIGEDVFLQFQGFVEFDDVAPFPILYANGTELFCNGSGTFTDTLPGSGFRGRLGRLGSSGGLEICPVFLGDSHFEYDIVFDLTQQSLQGVIQVTPPPLTITVPAPWIQIIGGRGLISNSNVILDWTLYHRLFWNGTTLQATWIGDRLLNVGVNDRLSFGKVYICNYTMGP